MDKAAIIHSSTPELPLPGVLIAQEPGADGVPRWVLGVGGYAGNHPAATLAGMQQRAAEMGVEQMTRLAQDGTPLGEPARYVFPFSLRRRYERLRRFPQGFLVMGDALTSFNPVYGQGMSVAACEALALQAALQQGPQGLAERFFRAAARVVDTPWQLAVGNDLSIPSVPGPRPLPVRVVNAYVARLMRVAVHDTVVARAFLEVLHLLKEPPSLFRPAIAWRVLRPGAAALPAATQSGLQPAQTRSA
jgi:2-polyprenyl-6-methoxyphenol hydroxylase-like FAD-dependent oxidoreductase